MRNQSDILDSLLVVEYQNGNKKALALLVKRWHSKFCHLAYGYTRNFSDAQDVVQDSWQTIIKKIKQIRDPNAFKSWASRIVVRKAIDRVRGNKFDSLENREIATEREEEPEPSDEGMRIKRVQRAIRNLPEKQQEVVRLFYSEAFSLDEIADILKISRGTVKSRLYYAREALKQILKTD